MSYYPTLFFLNKNGNSKTYLIYWKKILRKYKAIYCISYLSSDIVFLNYLELSYGWDAGDRQQSHLVDLARGYQQADMYVLLPAKIRGKDGRSNVQSVFLKLFGQFRQQGKRKQRQ